MFIYHEDDIPIKHTHLVSAKMEKLDASVNNSIGKLTTTIIAIKDEFNEKHNRHETKIAVMEEHLNHHVERRKS